MLRRLIIIISFAAIFTVPFFTSAHPGRTDAYGCHTCKTNCTSWGLSYGEYHCHNAKALPQPEAPIKSHYGESGAGYTTPAPEYSNTNTTDKNSGTGISKVNTGVSLENQIRDVVNKEATNYKKNPNGFREILIKKLTSQFKDKNLVVESVYSTLKDIK